MTSEQREKELRKLLKFYDKSSKEKGGGKFFQVHTREVVKSKFPKGKFIASDVFTVWARGRAELISWLTSQRIGYESIIPLSS